MTETLLPPGASFSGTVILKEWMIAPHDGKLYRAFVGAVSIVQDQDAVGFRTKGTESNWFARITGDSQTYDILGCQIRAVVEHAPGMGVYGEVLVVP